MEQFLAAVAQTLRNLGFADAVADSYSVTVRGEKHYARQSYRRKSFTFCGRLHRTGNVQQAVLDVISSLNAELLRRKEAQKLRDAQKEFDAFNESVKSYGLKLIKVGERFVLTIDSDLDTLKSIAKQIVTGQDIVFASLESRLAAFTSEGGFSLN